MINIKKQQERINAGRVDPVGIKPGDLVWYLRPQNSSNKLDSRWLGPAAIISKEGEHSYTVELKPNYFIQAPRVALKAFVPDGIVGHPTPLFFHRRTVPDVEATPEEWTVERI